MNGILRTFDPLADPTYKLTATDRLILFRSDKTHTEVQLSERYGGVSVSATKADGCDCVRFKMIDYTKHPNRWVSQVIELTDEQEDRLVKEACRLADVPLLHLARLYVGTANVLYGPKACKYDTIGVVLCNILRTRIIRSNKNWYWCSELVCHLIQQAYPDFNGHADTQTPESLSREWGNREIAA